VVTVNDRYILSLILSQYRYQAWLYFWKKSNGSGISNTFSPPIDICNTMCFKINSSPVCDIAVIGSRGPVVLCWWYLHTLCLYQRSCQPWIINVPRKTWGGRDQSDSGSMDRVHPWEHANNCWLTLASSRYLLDSCCSWHFPSLLPPSHQLASYSTVLYRA